jgi:hypothetical protein
MTGRTVWLASYPKSGNTWFRAVYTAWTDGGRHDLDPNRLATDVIASARIRIDGGLGVVSSLLRSDEADALRPVADAVLDRRPDGLGTGPRPCKIHDAYRMIPTARTTTPIVSRRATHGVVYLVRDPRDVAVSLAHHDGITYERAVQRLADDDAVLSRHRDGIGRQLPQLIGSWSRHVRSWLDDAPFRVHVVRYEDAIDDPIAAFGDAFRGVGFIRADGSGATDDDIARAVESASFDRLREAERRSGFRERPSTTATFFRSGRSGTWRSELPPDLVRRIMAAHATEMERLGYLSGDRRRDVLTS